MRWVAPVVVAAALAGAGLFLLHEGLDSADKYASVGGFLLALAVAGVSVALHVRRRSRAAPPMTAPDPAPNAGITNNISDAKVVVTGPGAVVDAVFNGGRRKTRRKK